LSSSCFLRRRACVLPPVQARLLPSCVPPPFPSLHGTDYNRNVVMFHISFVVRCWSPPVTCILCLRFATVTYACGACTTATGGTRCREKVIPRARNALLHQRSKMTSRSPSPTSTEFADSCFVSSENDSNKRSRGSDRSSSPAGRPPM
jgi:hypothetical protein